MEKTLYLDKFKKLFPKADMRYFLVHRNQKVFFLEGNNNISLYSGQFWNYRKKVLWLNLDQDAMRMWVQDKANFLINWQNFVEFGTRPGTSSIKPSVVASVVNTVAKGTSTAIRTAEGAVENAAEDLQMIIEHEKPLGGLVLLFAVIVVGMLK